KRISPIFTSSMFAPLSRMQTPYIWFFRGWGSIAASVCLVHGPRELEIMLREAFGGMRREQHIDAGIAVRPFGVMVELLGPHRAFGHEAEGLDEGLEGEALEDGI